ncbi:MAG: hypothetical protein H7X74_01280 [Methyloceanibacter sp.]|nr:hypothetical protein [Methyloceanibacter sp.]
MGADTRHVRGWLRRIASIALASFALVCLSGCGGGPGGPSGGGFFSGATSLFGGGTKIAVAPIIGSTPQVAQELSDALVAAGKDRGLTLLPDGGKANYTLRGYLVATTEGKGSKITYIWDVNDAQGSRVARVSGEEVVAGRSGADPWSSVDSAAIRSIAGKTASQLAASMPRGGGSASAVAAASDSAPAATASAPTPRVASPKAAGVVVAPVSGAPGDGQRSLTTALKKRLYAGGVKLANGPAVNVYMVKGSVSLADASGGKQSIRIDWQVLDPSGKKLGTVSQQNMIPRGSLNGPWGAIADAAAGAAAAGIIKLLPKSS